MTAPECCGGSIALLGTKPHTGNPLLRMRKRTPARNMRDIPLELTSYEMTCVLHISHQIPYK